MLCTKHLVPCMSTPVVRDMAGICKSGLGSFPKKAVQNAGVDARLVLQPAERQRHDVDTLLYFDGTAKDCEAGHENEQAWPAEKNISTVHSLRPWPVDKEVQSFLTLRLHPDQADGLSALCSIKHDVFTMCVESRKGSGVGCNCQALELAKIEITKLVLTLLPEHKAGFIVGYEGHEDVEVHCQARDRAVRNMWISVF